VTQPTSGTGSPPFAWRARVSGSEVSPVDVYVRKHHLAMGRSLEFDPEAPWLSPLEFVLGALGADLLAGFRRVAKERRLAIDRTEATVEGRLDNPLVHLGVVGESGHPGLVLANVKLFVSTLDPEAAVRAAWEEAIERSPLAHTLRPSVDLRLELDIVI